MTDDFIRIYDDAVSEDYCNKLIEKFESSPDQHEVRNTKELKKVDETTYERGNVSFKELHLWKHKKDWEGEINKLAKIFTTYAKLYQENYSPHCFPKKYGFEPFKMKRYMNNDVDEFGWHVDVRTFKNLQRFLAMFIYLEDNDGGKTEFEYQNKTIDCKKGSLVIFPPMWPWLHRGLKAVNRPKYFMGAYLHYVE